MTPKYVTRHDTGNLTSTARNERNWMTNMNNKGDASFHLVVDEKEIIECIPFNEVAWTNGDGYYGEGNRNSISVEVCESGDREKSNDNASTLIANVLKQYGLGIDKLRRHYDWSGKICPRTLSANNWFKWYVFKKEVEEKLRRL